MRQDASSLNCSLKVNRFILCYLFLFHSNITLLGIFADIQKSNRQVFESQEGLQIAFSEVHKIKGKVKKLVDDLNSNAPNYHIQSRDNRQHICDIRFKGHTLLVQFYQAYSNVADGSYLLFAVVDGLFDENGYANVFNPANILEIIRLDFSYDDNGQFGWRNQENKKQFFTSEEITDIWTEKFFKTILK